MEFPIVLDGKPVGCCTVEEQGLYWYLQAECQVLSDRVERLYCGQTRLGVLEREGDRLCLRRRLSRKAVPELPPRNGVLTLKPVQQPELWEGEVLGHKLKGLCVGKELLFPYDPNGPCPCEPLFCFFEIRDGFWRLPLHDPE